MRVVDCSNKHTFGYALLNINARNLKIVLCENIHQSAVDLLAESGCTEIIRLPGTPARTELAAHVGNAHILGVRSRTIVDAELLAAAPQLLLVACFCIGTNQVDIQQANKHGVVIFNAPHANTRSVAELVLGEIVMLMRGIVAKNNAAHRGQWQKSALGSHELRGKTLCIIGYGHIGSQVSILAEAFGMRVVFYDIERKLPLGNARAVKSMRVAFEQADVITLHVPDTPLTRSMISAQTLPACKKGTIIINASRGRVIDIPALVQALAAGRVLAAAIDVFPEEPQNNSQPFYSPLQGMENVLLTPHIGGSTEEAQELIGIEVANKILSWCRFGETQGSVNFPSITLTDPPVKQRIAHIHCNEPGVLQSVNQVIGDHQLNINKQYLETKGDLGYLLFDVDAAVDERVIAQLQGVNGTIAVRSFAS